MPNAPAASSIDFNSAKTLLWLSLQPLGSCFMPSNSEGEPKKLVTAQAAGQPEVTRQVGQLSSSADASKYTRNQCCGFAKPQRLRLE